MDKEKKILSFGKKKKEAKPDITKNIKSEPSVEYCSFCKRPNTQVPKLVAGPGVNICSECVLIAVQYLILQDGVLSAEAKKILDLLWGTTK